MPPTRTAPGLASASAPKKAKISSTAPSAAKTNGAADANSILPDLPLPKSFSRPQAQKAVNALLAYAKKAAEEKEETELLVKEEHVWLTIGLKSGAVKKKVSPVKIQLPFPALPPPPATSVCLLTKDPQREYKDLLDAQGIKFISRVVGVEKLKGKFKPFEARRQLMKDHEMFLCDERVVGLMPGLLGKIFYEAKKLPIPVNLKKKDLKTELAKAVNSTYFIPTTGTALSVRIATPSTSSASETLQNLLSAIPPVIAAINGGWDNVLSIGIKTSTSVLLPVWSAALSGRFDANAAAAAASSAANGDKKEKRKSVFDEWATEEKEEAERAKRFLLDNGEEVPKELDEMAVKAGKAKGKGKKEAAKVAEEQSEDEEESEDEEMNGGDDEEDSEEDEDEEEQEEAAPAPKKVAKSAPTPVKAKKTATPAKPAGKKQSQIAGGAGKRAKQAIVGAGKRK